MLFSSFGHRLLLIFGFLLTAILIVVAAKLGWLGEVAHDLIDKAWVPLQDFYDAQKRILNPAFSLIGFCGSALAAVWTVHKGWHYAERNLPERLKEYNARWKDAIETNRVEVIPALAQIASIAPPIVAEPVFFRKLILWVHDPDQRALAKCRYELAEREAELRVLTTSKVRCRAEVVTAHLTLGSRLAKVASHGGQSAVKAYEKAFGVNKTDLDTLELMAKQQFALGFEDQAFDCLDKLAEVASNASDQLRHARARRYQSEILLASESSSDWDRARANLVALIRALNGTDAIDLSKKLLELAFAHELLTKVQITREKFTAARTELKAAALLFRRIGAPDGPEGLERLEALSKELDEAEKDKDNPDVPD